MDMTESPLPLSTTQPKVTCALLHSLLKKQFPHIPNPEFKSLQQRELVVKMLERNESIVAILPTGGGKSLAIMLPSWAEEGLSTIVIVPNKALLDNLYRASEEANIPSYKWTVAHPTVPSGSRIIFLAIESVISNGFAR